MKPEIKQLWLEKLRSGEYLQARGKLFRVGQEKQHSYCCLGVLTDIYVKVCEKALPELPMPNPGRWVLDEPSDPWMAFTDEQTGFREWNFLPQVVQQWADWDGEGMGTLISMNDHGSSFTEIADWIEKNL